MSGNFCVCACFCLLQWLDKLVRSHVEKKSPCGVHVLVCAKVCWFPFFLFSFFFFTMASQAGALTRGEEKQGRVRKEGGEME